MELCRVICCSLTALHVSSDIFAHHQENINCKYSFWFYSRASLSAAAMTAAENIARNMYSSQVTINYPTQLHLLG
jgi:hypothetical protein